MTGLKFAFSDALVIAERSLRRVQRQPDLLTAFTIQPVMFIVLFVYVFGGAISVPPEYGDYTDFLMPGIMVQSIAFGGFVTALGLAEDLNKGLIDRFRSLPMARSAVLTGRTFADIATNALSLVVMIAVGLLVGFSFGTSAFEIAAGILLMLLIGYTFSWIFAWVGLSSGSPETANALGFMLIFPLTFLSSAFVPPNSMPASLEYFAENINPFSTMVDAMRALFIGTPAGNDIWGCIAWCVGLIAFFSFLSARAYSNAIRN